jgi:hypothetical protein
MVTLLDHRVEQEEASGVEIFEGHRKRWNRWAFDIQPERGKSFGKPLRRAFIED